MKVGDRVKYKTSKNSLQIYYGEILGFKEDREWFNIDEGIINSIAKKYGFKKYKQ